MQYFKFNRTLHEAGKVSYDFSFTPFPEHTLTFPSFPNILIYWQVYLALPYFKMCDSLHFLGHVFSPAHPIYFFYNAPSLAQ